MRPKFSKALERPQKYSTLTVKSRGERIRGKGFKMRPEGSGEEGSSKAQLYLLASLFGLRPSLQSNGPRRH